MTITYQDSQVDNSTVNTTSLSITFSATPTDGDLIILMCITPDPATAPVTVPTGFTKRGEITVDANKSCWIASRVADSEGSAVYSWTQSANDEAVLYGVVFRSSLSTPTFNFIGISSGSQADMTTAISLATVNAGSISNGAVAVGTVGGLSTQGTSNNDDAWTGTFTGGSATDDIDSDPTNSSLDRGMRAAYNIFTGAGTIGWDTYTRSSNSQDGGAFCIVFEEASGGGGGTILPQMINHGWMGSLQ